MFEYTETVDTVTVGRKRRETINKYFRKNTCKVENRDTDLVLAVDILFKARFKAGGKRYRFGSKLRWKDLNSTQSTKVSP